MEQQTWLELASVFVAEEDLAKVLPLINKRCADPAAFDRAWKLAFERRARRLLGRENNRLPPGDRLDQPIPVIASPVLLGIKWWDVCQEGKTNNEKDEKDEKEEKDGWVSVGRFSNWRVRRQPHECAEAALTERWCWRDRWSILGFLYICEFRDYHQLRAWRPKYAADQTAAEEMDAIMEGVEPRLASSATADEEKKHGQRVLAEGEWKPFGKFGNDRWSFAKRQNTETSAATVLMRSVSQPDQTDNRCFMAHLFLLPTWTTAKRWLKKNQEHQLAKEKLQSSMERFHELSSLLQNIDMDSIKGKRRRGPADIADELELVRKDMLQLSLATDVAIPKECYVGVPGGSRGIRPIYKLSPLDVDFACVQHGFDQVCGCNKYVSLGPDNPYTPFSNTVIKLLTLDPCTKPSVVCQILEALVQSDRAQYWRGEISFAAKRCLAAHGSVPHLIEMFAKTSRHRHDSVYHGDGRKLDDSITHAALAVGFNAIIRGPQWRTHVTQLIAQLQKVRREESVALERCYRTSAAVYEQRRQQQQCRKQRQAYRTAHPGEQKDREPDFGDCGDGIETVTEDGGIMYSSAPPTETEILEAATALAFQNSCCGHPRAEITHIHDKFGYDLAVDKSSSVFDSVILALELLTQVDQLSSTAWHTWTNLVLNGSPPPIRHSTVSKHSDPFDHVYNSPPPIDGKKAIDDIDNSPSPIDGKHAIDEKSVCEWSLNGSLEVVERLVGLVMPFGHSLPNVIRLFERLANQCFQILDSATVDAAKARALYVLVSINTGSHAHKLVCAKQRRWMTSTWGPQACICPSCPIWSPSWAPTDPSFKCECDGKICCWSEHKLWSDIATKLSDGLKMAKKWWPIPLGGQNDGVQMQVRRGFLHQIPLALETDIRWLLEAAVDRLTDIQTLYLTHRGDLISILTTYNLYLAADISRITETIVYNVMLDRRDKFVLAIRSLNKPDQPWFILGPHLPSETHLTGWANYSRFYVLVLNTKKHHQNDQNDQNDQKDQKLVMHALAVDVCDTAAVARLRPFAETRIASTYNDWRHNFQKIQGQYDPSKLPSADVASQTIVRLLRENQIDLLTEPQYESIVAVGLIPGNEPNVYMRNSNSNSTRPGHLLVGPDILFRSGNSFNDDFGLAPDP